MERDSTTTIRATFETREAADLAVEHLVQQHGILRPDIFVQSASDGNTAGARPSGGDASHDGGPSRRAARRRDRGLGDIGPARSPPSGAVLEMPAPSVCRALSMANNLAKYTAIRDFKKTSEPTARRMSNQGGQVISEAWAARRCDMERKDTSEPRPREVQRPSCRHGPDNVARFREAFPRARWSDRLNAWFVPAVPPRSGSADGWPRWRLKKIDSPTRRVGTSCPSRPIESRYLRRHRQPSRSGRPIHGPWSTKIREIPHARWDADAASGRCPTAHSGRTSANAGRNRGGRRAQ